MASGLPGASGTSATEKTNTYVKDFVHFSVQTILFGDSERETI